MASEWPQVQFADAPLEIIDGDRGKNYPKQEEFASVGHCLFLNTGNVTTSGFNFESCQFISEEKDSLLRKGKLLRNDIVLTTRGTVGNVAYYNGSVPYEHIRINSGMVIFRPNCKELLPAFLYQFFRSKLFLDQVSALRSGSAQPQLPIRDINRIQIRLPLPPEQQCIAEMLGSLDDKIELNRRMNRTLEKMAAAIFKSWFIDFDPVHAKAEGRDPNLPAEIADLFPDTFEDSELGEIPKGWRAEYLPEVIEVNPSRSLSRGTVAPYVAMKEMPTRLSRPTSWWRRKFGSGSKFQNGDVLLARITPCLENGKTAFVDFLDGEEVGWGSTEYIVLRSKPPLPPEFTYCLARSDRLREHAISNMTGTSGRQRVPATCFDRFPVVVPDDDVAVAFGQFVQPAFRKTKANDLQSRILEKTRDRLLPKLLSGEIEAPATADIQEGAA